MIISMDTKNLLKKLIPIHTFEKERKILRKVRETLQPDKEHLPCSFH
jgi:hypothetical protein